MAGRKAAEGRDGAEDSGRSTVAAANVKAERALESEREKLAERLGEAAGPWRNRLQKPVATVNRWADWVKSLKPYRVYMQFSHNEGNVLSAGMSYQSLFAVFAAVWLGFSILGSWVGSNAQVWTALVDIIDDAIPGLIGINGNEGVISNEALKSLGGSLGWTGLIAAVGLLWTAIAWLYYTRQAVRAIFLIERDTTNYVLQKIRDLGLALAFGILLVVSAVLSVVSTEALTAVFGFFGLPHDSFWVSAGVRTAGIVLVLALNALTLGTMFRVLSRVAIPWRSLAFGSLLGAAALSGLSMLSGLIFGHAGGNPLLASFTVFIGLLIYFNLLCKIILLSASWIAIGMADRGISARNISPAQRQYEIAVAEHNARVIVAQRDLETARAERDAAGGIRRLILRRRVTTAQRALTDIKRQRVTPPPGKKKSFWSTRAPVATDAGAGDGDGGSSSDGSSSGASSSNRSSHGGSSSNGSPAGASPRGASSSGASPARKRSARKPAANTPDAKTPAGQKPSRE